MKSKINVVFLGFGQASREHFNALKRVYRDRLNVVSIVEIDNRMLEYPDLVTGEKIDKKGSGIIIDGRPWHVRSAESSQIVASKYFNNFTIIEEKPLSTASTEKFIIPNTFRRFSPNWRKFQLEVTKSIGRVNYVTVTELNPTFEGQSQIEKIYDILPHSFSLVEDFLSSKIATEHLKMRENTFYIDSIAEIKFLRARASAAIVTVYGDRGYSIYNWPSEEWLHFPISKIRFLSNLKVKFRVPLVKKSVQNFFRFTWNLSLYSRFSDTHKFANEVYEKNIEYDNSAQLILSDWISDNLTESVFAVPPQRKFSHVIIGSTSKIAREFVKKLFEVDPKADLLFVDRIEQKCNRANVYCINFNQFYNCLSNITDSKVYYFSSAMGGPTPHHLVHNSKLEKIIEFCANSKVHSFNFLSSRTIFRKPNSYEKERHSIASSKKRGPYTFGKLIDTESVITKTRDLGLDGHIVYPGIIVGEGVPLTYGIKASIGPFDFVLGSKNSQISFCSIEAVVDSLMNRNELDNELTSFSNHFSINSTAKFTIFVPKFLTKIACVPLNILYRRIKPEESLWAKLSHFYT